MLFGIVTGGGVRGAQAVEGGERGPVEVSIVVVSTYLCFYFAELCMGTSAVLAVVVMGVYLNKHSDCLSSDSHHLMHCSIVSRRSSSTRCSSHRRLQARLHLLHVQYQDTGMKQDATRGRNARDVLVCLWSRSFTALLYPILKRMGTKLD